MEKETSLSDKIAEWADAIKRKRFTLEAEEVRGAVRRLRETLESQRKTTWDEDEEHSNNPIHQSDFIAMQKEIDEIFGERLIKQEDGNSSQA